jgi:hypothetical protein
MRFAPRRGGLAARPQGLAEGRSGEVGGPGPRVRRRWSSCRSRGLVAADIAVGVLRHIGSASERSGWRRSDGHCRSARSVAGERSSGRRAALVRRRGRADPRSMQVTAGPDCSRDRVRQHSSAGCAYPAGVRASEAGPRDRERRRSWRQGSARFAAVPGASRHSIPSGAARALCSRPGGVPPPAAPGRADRKSGAAAGLCESGLVTREAVQAIPQKKEEVCLSGDLTWIGRVKKPLGNQAVVWALGMLYFGGLHWTKIAERNGHPSRNRHALCFPVRRYSSIRIPVTRARCVLTQAWLWCRNDSTDFPRVETCVANMFMV